MSTHGIRVDELGFSEAVKSITLEVSHHMHGVTDRVRKGRAALKMLRFWLKTNDARQMTGEELSDVEDLVDMALEALPHHYEDINDPVDEMTGRARRAVEEGERRKERTEIALEALTVATWPNASVSDLNRQAQRLATVADVNECLVEAWESFKRLLAPRGLVVVVERGAEGEISGVSVLNAEALAEYRRLERATSARAAAEERFTKTLEASHAE